MDPQLEQYVNSARDAALMGNYQSALMEYDNTLAQLNRVLRQQGSPGDLLDLKKELTEEVNIIKKMEAEFAALKRRTAPRSASSDEGDIWGPPPPLPTRSFAKPPQLSRPTRPKVPAVLPNTRSYAKPWVPDKPLPSSAAADVGRTKYLHHIYGESGDGPDADLIQMIERDCVETTVSVPWESIAGLESVKELLQEAVSLPLLIPNYFTGIRRPWRGVLLYGPPGTGKTLLAKAVATECKCTFFNVSASTMASKYRGDSEKLVRFLFEMARFYAPTVIFFDEIDALCSRRGDTNEHESSRRVKAEILIQMDGAGTAGANVTVLAATNRPWDLDEALRRRLEKRVFIPLPDAAGRKRMFEISLKDLRLGADVDIDQLVKRTANYSGADLTNVCREAAMMGLRQRMKEARLQGISAAQIGEAVGDVENMPVTQRDFIEAVANVQKSVGSEDMNKFIEWTREFGATT